MGSHRFFYYLPEPGSPLRFPAFIAALARGNLEFNASAFTCAVADDGTLISVNEQHLALPTVPSLVSLVSEGQCVQALSHNTEIALTCTFGSRHQSPLISTNVSRNLWMRLSKELRAKYEQLLIQCGRDARAVNILVIDDPPDDFLGRIQEVDGQWVIDPQLPAGGELDPSTMWVQANSQIAAMREWHPTGRHIEDFQEYAENQNARFE